MPIFTITQENLNSIKFRHYYLYLYLEKHFNLPFEIVRGSLEFLEYFPTVLLKLLNMFDNIGDWQFKLNTYIPYDPESHKHISGSFHINNTSNASNTQVSKSHLHTFISYSYNISMWVTVAQVLFHKIFQSSSFSEFYSLVSSTGLSSTSQENM